ncbi:uncharacterized protein FIBRA_00256 [Fibroporia radiculosa]|uniref:Uncharacterized protein n=1 Tax=Fibroporia radiculosa TaxID=599839 RepID=J7RGQ9_9APHY|nr:uncharacterized protein FIBRA_00256 [Fibroporia radiculosa]CCL98262.1 predicted protein [Fibroporia radiculosa]
MSTPIDVTITNSRCPLPPEPTALPVDAPFIRFPPFPTPPIGATVAPFKSFKPCGIRIVDNLPENYVEIDGQGIPTAELRVKHDLTESELKRKRKSKTVTTSDGSVRRAMWYEEWDATESTRRTITPIDPSQTRADRLHQASQDFKATRTWPPPTAGLSQLWDAFRLYVGIISSIQPPASRKRLQQMQAAQAAADADEDDDDDDDFATVEPQERQVAMVDEQQARAIVDERLAQTKMPQMDEERQLRRENFREAKESRMDAFFNDTETNIKIFLSSHFRDKGLIWSEQRCRDAPILLRFFLEFLLRNRVLPEPEHEKGLRRAVLVTELARKELPTTFVIGKALPDEFSSGCEALWGNMTNDSLWSVLNQSENSKEEPEAKRRKVEDVEKKEVDVMKEVLGEANIEVLTPEVVKGFEQEVLKDHATAEVNVDGAQNADWGDAGWGKASGWDNADAPANEGWTEPATDTWNDSGSSWDIAPTPNPLMSFLGPAILPLTHTTGVIERSTRRIVAITPAPVSAKGPPAKKKKGKSGTELVEDELQTRFAKLTLAPWAGWDLYERSEISLPMILRDSRGAVVTEQGQDTMDTSTDTNPNPALHDPYKDEIAILITPSAAEKVVVGMGISATWIQIARQDLKGVDWTDEQTVPTKKGKGGLGEAGEPTRFWYMEQLISILPSYHTEA